MIVVVSSMSFSGKRSLRSNGFYCLHDGGSITRIFLREKDPTSDTRKMSRYSGVYITVLLCERVVLMERKCKAGTGYLINQVRMGLHYFHPSVSYSVSFTHSSEME